MGRLKAALRASVRWSWFGLLVLVAFGYLTAGLSEGTGRAPASGRAAEPMAAAAADPVEDESPPRVADGDEFAQTVAAVDDAWFRSLEARGLPHAGPADWLTVCRRMSLALVGTGVSLEEIRRLERYPQSQRADRHLAALLGDPRFHDYWAERWARLLVGTDNGEFIVYRRRRFRVWLAEQFASNVRYDRLVRKLITADGLWTDRPEVNFLTATFDSGDGAADPVRMAARTSRAFLALRIDCLQCHDDFLGNVSLGDPRAPRAGTQQDFHRLAAFYSSAETDGLQGIRSGPPDYRVKYLGASDEVEVEPGVPYQPELLPDDGPARERLAAWITHPDNRQAARAAVSHVWALMFGRPIADSVDNLPLDGPPLPVLEALSDDFIAGGYDLRRLIRLIAGSEPFRVDSRAAFEITPEHERGWAVFPLVRLRPEQVVGSVIQSARVKRIDRDSSFIVQLQKFGGTNDFVRRYGDLGEDEFNSESVTISQRLLMLNGDTIDESIEFNPLLNASAHIAMFAEDDTEAVRTAYLCTLNRLPSDRELAHFTSRIAESDERGEALVDLFWVLVNSTEFAWNH